MKMNSGLQKMAMDISKLITLRRMTSPASIKEEITKALERVAAVDAKQITVTTHDGTVILSGTVRSLIERDEAERVASGTPGISQIENRIEVV